METNKIFFLLTVLAHAQITFTMQQSQAYVDTNEQGQHVLVDPEAEALFAAVDEINRKNRVEFMVAHTAPHMRPEDRQLLTQPITMQNLHEAARAGNIDATRKALEENPGIVDMATEEGGYTALHFAARKGHVDIAKLLLEYGAQIAQKSTTGNTTLHFAAKDFKSEMVALLLQHGAPVNEQDNNGYTPLHCAAVNLDAATLKVLLDNGAQSLIGNNGMTPLALARQSQNQFLSWRIDASVVPQGCEAGKAIQLLEEHEEMQLKSAAATIPGGPSI